MNNHPIERLSVGVDFGGTSVKLALVDGRGGIRAQTRFATAGAGAPDLWIEAVGRGIAEMQATLPAPAPLTGIGVGVPGFVDFAEGYVHDVTNVTGWLHFPLKQRLTERLGLPAVVDNDVNAMAVGECAFGAGRAFKHAVFVTLGTGVGGALLIDGRLYRGAHSMAGEIGHVSINMNGMPSPQGKGCLEQYVGNRRLVARAAAELRHSRPSLLRELCQGRPENLTVEMIFQAAARGDRLGLELFEYMADCLAAAFASVAYVLQPEAFIIGGGVAQSGELLFAPLRRFVAERMSPHFAKRLLIKPAELGNEAGVIGAATLAFG